MILMQIIYSKIHTPLRMLKKKLEATYTSVKETYGRGAGCMEDGRDGRIRAMEYAGGNGTQKRGGSAERSEEKGEMRNV